MIDSKEADSKEADSKEADSKEADSKEVGYGEDRFDLLNLYKSSSGPKIIPYDILGSFKPLISQFVPYRAEFARDHRIENLYLRDVEPLLVSCMENDDLELFRYLMERTCYMYVYEIYVNMINNEIPFAPNIWGYMASRKLGKVRFRFRLPEQYIDNGKNRLAIFWYMETHGMLILDPNRAFSLYMSYIIDSGAKKEHGKLILPPELEAVFSRKELLFPGEGLTEKITNQILSVDRRDFFEPDLGIFLPYTPDTMVIKIKKAFHGEGDFEIILDKVYSLDDCPAFLWLLHNSEEDLAKPVIGDFGKNIFHLIRFPETLDSLWEKVYPEIPLRVKENYDLFRSIDRAKTIRILYILREVLVTLFVNILPGEAPEESLEESLFDGRKLLKNIQKGMLNTDEFHNKYINKFMEELKSKFRRHFSVHHFNSRIVMFFSHISDEDYLWLVDELVKHQKDSVILSNRGTLYNHRMSVAFQFRKKFDKPISPSKEILQYLIDENCSQEAFEVLVKDLGGPEKAFDIILSLKDPTEIAPEIIRQIYLHGTVDQKKRIEAWAEERNTDEFMLMMVRSGYKPSQKTIRKYEIEISRIGIFCVLYHKHLLSPEMISRISKVFRIRAFEEIKHGRTKRIPEFKEAADELREYLEEEPWLEWFAENLQEEGDF